MRLLSSLDEIAADYDAILCDVWGVLHNGKQVYAAACDALARFREGGGVVVLVTNVPRPRGPIPHQLGKLGVREDAYDVVVTSGDAIRAELALRAPGPMFKIGPPYDRELWDGLGLEMTALDNAAFIGVSGLNDDRTETPADYADMLAEARARDLELLIANPDIVVRVGEKLIWCAGALARDYEKIGGRVVMAGKPHPPIYSLAYQEIEALTGRAAPKPRLLAIGDGAPTDVKGAQNEGLDCLFVAGGIHSDIIEGESINLGAAEAVLAQEGVSARYAMTELA
ncbi:MAG: TIGR01459 family HAD-type hydrolase [Hyphomonadaceae bacterium]